MVHSMEALDGYPWSGHGVLVGTRTADWQATDEVLARFGRRRRDALRRYREFVAAGWGQGHREELSGGGLVRSAGGAGEVLRRKMEEREAADERVLGSGTFVETVWRAAEQPSPALPQRAWTAILDDAAAKWGVERGRILGSSRERLVCRARREFLVTSQDEAGLSVTQLARLCAMNPASVSRAIEAARTERREPIASSGGKA